MKGFWTIQSWNKRTFKDFSAADTFISRKILKSFQMTFFFIIVEISGFFFCYFLIFYVKSISENLLRCSKPELWFHVKSEWQINSVISILWFTVWKFHNFTITHSQFTWNQFLPFISRKIRMTDKFCHFHTVVVLPLATSITCVKIINVPRKVNQGQRP